MRAENERLRHEHLAEVASLRSEHEAEVASLRAEVASLHAQLGIKGAEDDEDLELGAEAMHMAAPPPSDHSFKFELATSTGARSSPGSSCPSTGCDGCWRRGRCRTQAKFPRATRGKCEQNKGVWCQCPTHCKGDCKIPTKKWNEEFLSSECVVGRAFWKKRIASGRLAPLSVGTPEHPEWKLGKAKLAPTVDCPCHLANGGTLDAETALRRIVGQVVLCKRNRV